MTDEQLIQRYYQCDEAAYASLYGTYWRQLCAFLSRLGAEPQDAADLVQQTFTKVVLGKNEQRAQFEPREAKFSNWLYRIARNEFYTLMRRRKARSRREAPPAEGVAPAEREQDGRTAPTEPPDSRPDPESVSAAQEFLQALRDCLASLTPDRREAVVLVYWLGLTGKEAAFVMDRSENAVTQLLHNAASDLRQCLNKRGCDLHQRIASEAVSEALSESVEETVDLLGKQTSIRLKNLGGKGS